MGSGKSTVGAALAEQARRSFRDNDDALRDLTGLTAREIAAEKGIDELHDLERRALEGLVRDRDAAIVAAAASTVDTVEGRMLLRKADEVIWLAAPLETLVRRVEHGQHRHDPEQTLRATLPERDAGYRALATLVADATEPADVIVDALATALQMPAS
jgi:shikimate kinase